MKVTLLPFPDWRGTDVVCIASGPSLTAEDCDAARASGVPTIVTNSTFRACPWAFALVGFDFAWWRVHMDEVRQTFRGRLFCQSSRWALRDLEWPGAHPRYRSFGNSGACAIALAVACRARRVILIGYDGQATGGRSHHHGDHPAPLRNCDTMPAWPLQFSRLATWADARGVPIVNATRETALEQFPRVTLAEAFDDAQRRAA